MDQDATRRVVTTMPLLIDNAERPAGTVLELPAADAQAMVEQGRATEAPKGRQAAKASADKKED